MLRRPAGPWGGGLDAAARPPRVTTVFAETVDGAPAVGSAAELALLARLRAEGVTLVDEAQSRKIRSVTDAGRLLASGVSPVLTSLDADVILAGSCRMSRLRSDLLGSHAFRFDATLDVKALAVDTGGVLGALSTRGKGLAFSADEAAAKAARDAAERMAPLVLGLLAQRSPAASVELTVEGCPNVTACERTIQALRGLDGVGGVDLLRAGRQLTKLAVHGLAARDLALALDAGPGVGLSVFGYSERAIKAAYDPARAMRLSLVLGMLSPRSKTDAGAAGRVYAELIGVALSNVGFLAFPGALRALEVPQDTARWPALLARMGVAKERSLVLVGRHRRAGERIHLDARLVAAASGETVFAAQRSCPQAAAHACAAALRQEQAGGLSKAVYERRDALAGLKGLVRPGGGAAPPKPLEIIEVAVPSVFPARLQAYARTPAGRLRVRNRGAEPIERLRLRTTLDGLTGEGVDASGPDLAPGRTADLPVTLVLDAARSASLEENRPGVLRIELSYAVGGFQVSQRWAHPLVVYDRNALTWSEPDSVAAFVTARAEGVRALAQSWLAALPASTREQPLGLPAALLAGLADLGVRYVADPVNPISTEALDQVLYPLQTLAAGGGDCDDLSVLLAALAESVGRRALLLVAPDHVFVALHAGLPPQGAVRLTVDEGKLLAHGGELWLPLEATLVGRPLAEAWSRGAELLSQWHDRGLRIVDVRAAWQRFGPVSLVAPVLTRAGDTAAVGRAATLQVDALRAAYEEAVEARLADLRTPGRGDVPGRANQRGVLLAALGRSEEARAAFTQAVRGREGFAAAHSNLGSLLLTERKVGAARAAYRAALQTPPGRPRIHVNAALAALADGDEDAFSEHVFSCLEQGADDVVEALSRAGVDPGQARGAQGGGLGAAKLRALVRRAYVRAGRSLPAAADGRRASEAGGSLEVARYLFWLR